MRWPLLLLFLWAMPAVAQEQAREPQGEIYEPPRSPAAETYREAARTKSIRVEARTLSKDAPLTLRPPARRFDISTSEGSLRILGWLVVIALVGFVIFALVNARFGDLWRREDKPVAKMPQKVELADVGSADLSTTRLGDLARMDDPREGLRLLLLMGLSRAADANEIVLRRSLTARDVFARVPRTWRAHDVLDTLVRRAELVLFGGRPFDREELSQLVETARPMLDGRS